MSNTDDWDLVPRTTIASQAYEVRSGDRQHLCFEVYRENGTKYLVKIGPASVERLFGAESKPKMWEIFPGPREEAVCRALQKIVFQKEREMTVGEPCDFHSCSVNKLRTELIGLERAFNVSEIRESLVVLNGAHIEVRDHSTDTILFSGPQMRVAVVKRAEGMLRQAVEFAFTKLTAISHSEWLLRSPHYERIMTLHPLASWLYRSLVRSVLAAGPRACFSIELSRVLAESGVARYRDLRKNVKCIREAIRELMEEELISYHPIVTEEQTVVHGRGRSGIADVRWNCWPGLKLEIAAKE